MAAVSPISAVKGQSGFTLIELLVSMFILVTGVTVAWSAMMTTTVKTTARAEELANLQTEVRSAVDTLASDLRQAQCLDTTITPVTTATGSQITFYTPDRATPYHLRQVSYRVNGSQLERALQTSTNTGGPPWTMPGSLGPWSKLVGSVTSASPFTYKTASGAVTTTASTVASANVTLTIAPPAAVGGAGATYATNISLRTDTCE
jgi:prepilin-type N-terminal cleavage/methylation domain-containing protein